MGFFSSLEKRANEINSLLCVGLDPHISDLAEPTADAAKAYCLELIQATRDLVLAYKPNIAFFEAFGSAGIEVLKEVIQAIPETIPVILDAKRGDVAATAGSYANAAYEMLGAHAVTVNPYLGFDSINPFIKDELHGTFLVCKTSNPGSADIQDIPLISGKPVFEHIAFLARGWNTQDNIGLTVGSSYPNDLQRVRKAAPTLWILTPLVAGPDDLLEKALAAGLRPDGFGMVITVSRQIAQAQNPHKTAKKLRDRINAFRRDWVKTPPILDRFQHHLLAKQLFDAGCIKFGYFLLNSGFRSPVYIDLTSLTGKPDLLFKVASAYHLILESLTFSRIAALPYAGIPIGTAVSLQGNWPMIYPRKGVEGQDTIITIEGEYHPGERVVIVEALTTAGVSKYIFFHNLLNAGLILEDVVVLVDSELGALEELTKAGYRLHSVFTLSELVGLLEEQNLISPDQKQSVLDFIKKASSS